MRKLLGTYLLFRRRVPLLRFLRRRYGNEAVVRIRAIPFGEVVLVFDPALVKPVLTAPADVLHAGEGRKTMAPRHLHMARVRRRPAALHRRAFAQMEMRVALQTILDRVDWEHAGRWPERQVDLHVSIVPTAEHGSAGSREHRRYSTEGADMSSHRRAARALKPNPRQRASIRARV